ncbi:MAG: flagellum-specific ATP synthase FliI, partial [Pseudomonadota bacterium]|nr:flagellum-specific ATP synthase FliI [Pseudomonadota bacterium]
AIAHIGNMRQFLQQGLNESAPLTESIEQLLAVVPERRSPERRRSAVPNPSATGGGDA